jgi:hypothetical protein
VEPLRVAPWVAPPETAGRAVFVGAVAAEGAAATIAVGLEEAGFDPDEFVAVTTTRIVAPTSAAARR